MSKPFFVKLPNRGKITLTGDDRRSFLQGLITNDVNLLDTQESLYACLLTPQGKFLFDFFITEHENALILDCEGGERAEALAKHLTLYKLRANVTIETVPETPVYAILSPENGMGTRSFTKPEGLGERPFTDWDKRRIVLCIPDGSRDMVPERSFPLEYRIDELKGISFTKGCYVGQEVTARTKHRGTVKKHLYALQFDGAVPAFGSDINVNGKAIGTMRSSCNNLGLALLRDEALFEDLPFRLLHP